MSDIFGLTNKYRLYETENMVSRFHSSFGTKLELFTAAYATQ